jgi:alpha-tubulin suppressor-like RCC1 family protein
MPGLYTTGFQEKGIDIGRMCVEKAYLMEVYPSLVDWTKAPGLWSWGINGYGNLGNNTVVNQSSPVQTVAFGANWRQASSSSVGTAAIKADGTLWTWGINNQGQLGDNSVVYKSSPVQTVSGGTNWLQVSLGNTCQAAIKTDGTLWTWGGNAFGQLGDNTIAHKSSPVQTVSGGTNWKSVSAGTSHVAAIKTDGTLWVWGSNSRGDLGDNTVAPKSSPVQTVSGGTNWRQVSAGYTNTAAIKTDGTLWTWGHNNYGQLGNNAVGNTSSPAQTVSAGTNWRQVVICESGYAIKTDGTLWAWGKNVYGQLGDNTLIRKSSPVQTVAAGTTWRQVSTGPRGTFAAAVKTDGTLWSWGLNTTGQLGDNTSTGRSSPVQTVSGGNNWKSVSAGVQHSVGLRESDDF